MLERVAGRAGVRGDARARKEPRIAQGRSRIHDPAFFAAGAVENPDRKVVPGRKDKDLFTNFKAQRWWDLRQRF